MDACFLLLGWGRGRPFHDWLYAWIGPARVSQKTVTLHFNKYFRIDF